MLVLFEKSLLHNCYRYIVIVKNISQYNNSNHTVYPDMISIIILRYIFQLSYDSENAWDWSHILMVNATNRLTE